MTDFWRIPDGDEPAEAPDWVLPFLSLDDEWANGRAEGQSSGSTGTPKTFEFTPGSIVASAKATAAHFGLNASDAYQLERGLMTFDLRMRAHNSNGHCPHLP